MASFIWLQLFKKILLFTHRGSHGSCGSPKYVPVARKSRKWDSHKIMCGLETARDVTATLSAFWRRTLQYREDFAALLACGDNVHCIVDIPIPAEVTLCAAKVFHLINVQSSLPTMCRSIVQQLVSGRMIHCTSRPVLGRYSTLHLIMQYECC